MVSIYCVSASLFLFPTVVVFLFFLVLAFILLPFWPRHCHVTHRRFPAVACKILFLATALRGLIYIRFGKQGSRAARSGSSEHPPPLPLEPRRSFLAEPLGRSSQGRRFSCRAPPPSLAFRLFFREEMLHSILGWGGGAQGLLATPDDAGAAGGGGRQSGGLGAGSWRMTGRDSCPTAAPSWSGGRAGVGAVLCR